MFQIKFNRKLIKAYKSQYSDISYDTDHQFNSK